jgi:hypothetical protein
MSVELLVISLLVLVALLVSLVYLSWWRQDRLRTLEMTNSHQFLSKMATIALEGQREQLKMVEQHSALLDKAIGLLATKDPLAFQQVQVMTASGYDDNTTYDPSEEAEIERIAARNPDLAERGDEVNGYEESFLSDAGIDPAEFYRLSSADGPPAE